MAPSEIQVSLSDEQVRGWGLAGNGGGLFWVQDYLLEGKPIDEVRSALKQRTAVQAELAGLPAGLYSVAP